MKSEEKGEAPPPAVNVFEPISSAGLDGLSIYRGVDFLPKHLEYAKKYKDENKATEIWLQSMNEGDVAHYLLKHDKIFADMVASKEGPKEAEFATDVSDMGLSDMGALVPSSHHRRPLEDRVKDLSNRCHEKAKQLASRLVAKSGGDIGKKAKEIHQKWVLMGNRWQSNKNITEEELQRKLDWLDGFLRRTENVV